MGSVMSGVKRVLWATGVLSLFYFGSPVAEEAVDAALGPWGATASSVLGAWGVERADAQFGVARRTARRTAWRWNALYALPAGYTTVVVGGVTYYEVSGVRYQAEMVEGEVVYVVVT